MQITVADGKITEVDAVQYPHGNGRDQQINAYALPCSPRRPWPRRARRSTTSAGATVTSDGYVQSLQSALDKANL